MLLPTATQNVSDEHDTDPSAETLGTVPLVQVLPSLWVTAATPGTVVVPPTATHVVFVRQVTGPIGSVFVAPEATLHVAPPFVVTRVEPATSMQSVALTHEMPLGLPSAVASLTSFQVEPPFCV
jgi:hypothetical protein